MGINDLFIRSVDNKQTENKKTENRFTHVHDYLIKLQPFGTVIAMVFLFALLLFAPLAF